ncbi:MAG: glycosyltransferase [Deferribacteres bacterium]|nr:glycosyltransferase family 2 protein [candidate division KSB1 bacterium]MCB9501319.1 glycosyltransferase [Deferribacteres bacterium]
MQFLNGTLLVLYVLALFGLALFGIHKYVLIYRHWKYSKHKTSIPQPPKIWPKVLVQLPIYNEKYVLKRLLKAVVNLNYPNDKLHIQVLDDSTDKTKKLATRLVALLRKKGIQIEHLVREERVGFKAGALEYGLSQSNEEYIAIFDADFIPQDNFLQKTIPHLAANPGVGMVQTRWGHLNLNYSLLTKLQGIFLDAHFLLEHFTRFKSGKFFNFNGTAGVWRRRAIEDAGGWQHDTLTEDLDLSYRSQLAGWKFIFLADVVAPAELPVDMNAYKSQQHRWAKGSVQTAIKLLPALLKSKLPLKVRIEALLHLSSNFAYLLMTIPAFLLIPMLNIQWGISVRYTVLSYFFMFFAATFSVIVYYFYTIKLTHEKTWPTVLYIPALMALGIGLSVNNGKAVLEALAGIQTDFLRTPKFNIKTSSDGWMKKKYKASFSRVHVIELLLAIYFTLGMSYFFLNQLYLSIPFFMLFQFGYYYIALASIGQGVRARKNKKGN